MAAGPFPPISMVLDASGNLTPTIFVGDGANAFEFEGVGVIASLAADSKVRLTFAFPVGALPTGTCKLRSCFMSDAAAGSVKYSARWASVAVGEDPSSATLQNEGTTTVTWASGDNDKIKESKVVLDGDTPVHSQFCVMDLVFETSGWDLAQEVVAWFGIMWE